MSDYVKMGNGMLFPNEKRDNDKAPVWTGPITIVNKDGSERKARKVISTKTAYQYSSVKLMLQVKQHKEMKYHFNFYGG